MKLILLSFVLFVGSVVPTFAECPGFPQRGVEIIEIFLVNHRGLAQGDDDARRLLTKMIAEQMRFELGAWSTKSASSIRPPSKDSLARPINNGPTFCNWDWQHGTTRERSVMTGQAGEFIDDQHLLPTAAVNHLGNIVQLPTQPLPSVDIVLRLDRIESIVRDHVAQMERIKTDQDNRDARLVKLMEDSRGRDESLAAQLKKHDDEPMWLMKILGNRYVQGGLALVAGLVGQRVGLFGGN